MAKSLKSASFNIEGMTADQIEKLREEAPYFNERKIEEPLPKYVAWVDILGTKSFLSTSSRTATIHIGKLHVAALAAKKLSSFSGELYALVDGVYAVCDDIDQIQSFVKALMRRLSIGFIFSSNENRCMVRGAISFGKVIEGSGVLDASDAFNDETSKSYIKKLVVGTPISRAYSAEGAAPPFGIWVDENARHFSPNKRYLPFTFWPWWDFISKIPEIDDHSSEIMRALSDELRVYLEWCAQRDERLLYPAEAIKRHTRSAAQYFQWPAK